MTGKRGRPEVSTTKKARQITLRAEHIAMLDDAIEERYRGEDAAAALQDPDGEIEGRMTLIAKRRREFLGELIEEHCSFDARHPVEIEVIAPARCFGDADDVASAAAEVEAWRKDAAARLAEEAPEAVRLALEWAALLRLGRKDPAAMRRALATTLAQAEAGDEVDD